MSFSRLFSKYQTNNCKMVYNHIMDKERKPEKKEKYKPSKSEKWSRLLFAIPVIAVLVYILIQFLGK